jgi:hypothetical protein
MKRRTITSSRYPLITRDPVTGEELTVTRLENRARGLVLEGEFSLGWLAKLSHDQLEFVGLFLRYRGNVQKMASELGVAYNTARSRLDAIVEALGGTGDNAPLEPELAPESEDVLSKLETGEIDFETALKRLKR